MSVGKPKVGKGGVGVYVGDVGRDRVKHRNWFVGAFVREGNLRCTKGVEIKWSVHGSAFRQGLFKYNRVATTACMVLRGRVVFEFEDGGRKRTARRGGSRISARSHEANEGHEGFEEEKGCSTDGGYGREDKGLGDRYTVVLRRGEYVIWGPGVAHKMIVPRAAEMMVVRWPSVAGDQRDLDH